MARNQEKAQTMLARWLRFKEEQVKGPKKRRPYLAELCDNLHEAEKWRGSIIKDISRNVAEIQNASLGEHRIRDINDRINKLFREKRHWERRIKELGGKDYRYSNRGYGGYGHGAYLYFGAAKDLPGVRQLLNESEQIQISNKQKYENKDRVTGKDKKSRAQMYQLINADYYGFGDDDDNDLIWREKAKEQKLRRAKIQQWEQENPDKIKQRDDRKRKLRTTDDRRPQSEHGDDDDGEEDGEEYGLKRKRMRLTKVSGYVPSQQEIDDAILQKRKELLLKKYVGNDGDTEEAKSLAKSLQIQQMQERLRQNDATQQDNKDDEQDTETPANETKQ
eukprot:CAMPEP_0197075194 /NCGR_PEP_ID=MMETSP1384-20130603/211487_1 /TAXON_ID=29189 /ORGANISM="Ammonia sp." /LENGTH=333 /DNA_ID=CAMNT_0042514037 /DNA_START=49 /DNA_END=1050 /DNA_ORIENTATION=-